MFDTVRYVLWRLWLWATRDQRIDRFVKNIDWHSNDPFLNGALTSAKEFEYELPKANLSHCEDVIEFFLQNSKQQVLFARISRLGKGLASMSFYVRLGNQGSWKSESVVVDQTTSDCYVADALRIEVVQSMKRYKISFNGLVYNSLDEPKHMRAVFVGNFITGCGDYKVFHDEHFLAKQLPIGMSLKSLEDLDIYVQTFSVTGKVYVESLEEEVYLWGYRRKQSLDRQALRVKVAARLTTYTKNGLGLDLNEATFKDHSTNLMFGHLNYPALQERPIQNCSVDSIVGRRAFRIGAAQFKNLTFSIESTIDEFSWIEPIGQEWFRFGAKLVKITYDGNEGYGLLAVSSDTTPFDVQLPYISPYVCLLGQSERSTTKKHVLQFNDALCRAENLTGGKGSSLAVLTDIASKNSELFKVSKGICVTTEAYGAFVASPKSRQAIEKLIAFCGTEPSNENLQRLCEETRQIVASERLPEETLKSIQLELEDIFGSAASTTKFAVRSSACGEDSENMSAAGQMETYLGIVGFDALAVAVAKCWASQFSFVAVQYKRRYGQLIDSNMCVVVQQMVASDVSGVMFTVDPITASPLLMSITANYGLGESVVSASADPDTFTVSRDPNGSLSLKNVQLGQKMLSTVVKESGGTEDIRGLDRSSEQTLTTKQILQLAKIGLLLEKEYASPRDTEWAFEHENVYMLQARPVTSVDNIDTEFETFHEGDSGLVAEFDSLSKANVGEVFGGSVSTLSQAILSTTLLEEKRAKGYNLHPHARLNFFIVHHSQFFFPTFSDLGALSETNMASKGYAIAMAGRVVDDEIVKKSCANKTRYLCDDTPKSGIIKRLPIFWTTTKAVNLMEEIKATYSPEALKKRDIRDIFFTTLGYPEVMSKAMSTHVQVISYGALSNVAILSLLANTDGGFTTNVFGDFSCLVSSCNNIFSARVPQMLQKIAYVIESEYGKNFADLNPEVALKTLKQDDTESAKLFGEFLKDHGHRSLHELDLVTRTWGMEPIPLVKTLQSMLLSDSGSMGHSQERTIDQILDQMSIKLSWWKRQLLKQILYRVRKGVALRERAKSCMVNSIHQFRRCCRYLAQRMVEEGRIPEEDLLFFFLPDELLNFIETRNPRLIVRAMNRMKNAKTAAKNVYPEHVACPPFIPTNLKKAVTVPPTGARSMKGTPVSKGRVVASACVISHLEDANLIRKGDILITYATDIGWSPYFPLLSGIVTELGGLISHGAVIAREYGIPCIVGCHGATNLFNSGEEVLLDGYEGLISTTSAVE